MKTHSIQWGEADGNACNMRSESKLGWISVDGRQVGIFTNRQLAAKFAQAPRLAQLAKALIASIREVENIIEQKTDRDCHYHFVGKLAHDELKEAVAQFEALSNEPSPIIHGKVLPAGIILRPNGKKA
jgi:hypothetical protein